MRNWRTWAIVAALVAGFLASEWWDWRGEESPRGGPEVRTTPRFQDLDYVPLSLPVLAPEIPDKDLERVREKYQRPDLVGNPGEVIPGSVVGPIALGEFQLSPMPGGADVLVTRETDGRVKIDPVAIPRPFIEWKREWEFGGGYQLGAYSGTVAWSRWSPVRIGTLRPFVEGGMRPGSGGYVMAGVVARF